MELSAEEKVTKILSSYEVLKNDKSSKLVSEPKYDLGNFLEKCNKQPSKYGEKYLFIK